MQLNQIVRFTGYSPALVEGQSPILQPGQLVQLFAPGVDASGEAIEDAWAVRSVDEPYAPQTETCFAGAELIEVTDEESAAGQATLDANLASQPQPVVESTPSIAPPVKAPKAPKKAAAPKAPKAEKPAKEAKVKPEKAPKEKPAKVVKEVVPFHDSDLVTAIIGQDALGAAVKLAADRAAGDYTLGGVLSYIKRHKSHLTINNADGSQKYTDTMEGFAAYVADLGIADDYRVVQLKINAYEAIASLGLPAEQELKMIAMGYTKLSQVSRLAGKSLTKESAEDVIADLAGKNTEEVKAYVKTKLVEAGGDGLRGPQTEKSIFHFVLFGDQGETVKRALAAAKQSIGKSPDGKEATDSDAAHLIATRYLEALNPQEVPLASTIEQLEIVHGVKITVEETQPEAPAPAENQG